MEAPDLQKRCFYYVKTMIFTKSTFSVQTTFLNRFSWILLPQGSFWTPFGTLLAALGRSWGATWCSRGAPGTLLDPLWGPSGELLGAPGAILPSERGPQAPGRFILSAPGLDFRRFTAVIPHVAPRMMRPTLRAAVCAQHLELTQNGLRTTSFFNPYF